MQRYGRQNSQKFSLKPGNKRDKTLNVLVVVYISIVLPAVSSIVWYCRAAGVVPETEVQNTHSIVQYGIFHSFIDFPACDLPQNNLFFTASMEN